jgi:hypothetical protein
MNRWFCCPDVKSSGFVLNKSFQEDKLSESLIKKLKRYEYFQA